MSKLKPSFPGTQDSDSAYEAVQDRKFKKRNQFQEVWRRLKRNKFAIIGMVILLLLVMVAIFAEQLAPYYYDNQDISVMLTPPGADPRFPLGTDNLGRDLLSRLIYGARVSLTVGLIAISISAILGGTLGAIAGFCGGIIENIIMRFMDILLAIPGILLAMTIAATLGPGMINVIIAVGISSVPSFARIVRSSVLLVKDKEYIEAAQAINASGVRIITKHIFPNILAPVIVQITLGTANAILQAATLSFLGLGVRPPMPEWGSMISAGRNYLRDYGYMVTVPGLAIMITIVSINLLGDGLRDALDPRLKR